MCYESRRFSANMPMYTRHINGMYYCHTVNVIDMSGNITKRVDCTPVYNMRADRSYNLIY